MTPDERKTIEDAARSLAIGGEMRLSDDLRAIADLAASAPDLLRIVRTLVDALGTDEDYGVTTNAALAEGAEILRRLDHE